jgi:cold shock protein
LINRREHRVRPAAFRKVREMARTGVVKFFNTTKGFGFVAPEEGGNDVFVHATAVQSAGLRGLNEGQRVSFDIEADQRGPKVVNLRLV